MTYLDARTAADRIAEETGKHHVIVATGDTYRVVPVEGYRLQPDGATAIEVVPPSILGYTVEHVGEEPGSEGYRLHGPKAQYRLMRHVTNHRRMYVLNMRGNITSIKGNYTFSDASGRLEVIS